MGSTTTWKKLLAVLSAAVLLAALAAVAPWAGDPAGAQTTPSAEQDIDIEIGGDEDGAGDNGSSGAATPALDVADPARDAAEANNLVEFAGIDVDAAPTGPQEENIERRDIAEGSGGDPLAPPEAAAADGGTVAAPIAGINGAVCAFDTVNEALAAAPVGAIIRVAPGTHQFSNTNANGNIGRNVTIEQGGTNCQNVTAGATANNVVLQLAPGSTTDAVIEVFSNASAVLRDLTVEGGNSTEGTVFVPNGDLTLDNVIVRNGQNPSTTLGGGGVRIASNGSVLSINNSQIINNDATAFGGGVYVNGGSFTIDGLDDVELNSADDGGGIAAVNGATVLIDNNGDVIANTATGDGGGVYVGSGSTVTFDGDNNTSVFDNEARRGGGVFIDSDAASLAVVNQGRVEFNTAEFGGGAYTTGGTVRVNQQGEISNNDATTRGGGILAINSSRVELNDAALIDSNSSTFRGGGIWADNTATLQAEGSASNRVQITNNSAGSFGGGVVLSAGATATLDTVRVSGNTAVTDGGGLWVANDAIVEEFSSCDEAETAFERYCNEFALNTAANGGAIYISGGDVFIEQTAFFQNEATSGGQHAIAAVGSSSLDIQASILRAHPSAGGTGNGVITVGGTSTAELLAVTIVPGQTGFDLDGTGTAQFDRVLNAGLPLLTGGSPFTGQCNLDASNSSSWGSAGVVVANPQFQTTANSAFVPGAPQAIDACPALGRSFDIGDQGVIDGDGSPSGTEFDIGAWEAPTAAPMATCNGLPVDVFISLGQLPTGGNDVILGTPGDDVITASTGADTICALGGDDTINAGPGNDWVDAGAGADTVFGLDGNDTIFGRDGRDQVVAGNGNDRIEGGSGIDRLNGGPGADILLGGTEGDFLFGQSGNDNISGNAGDDLILGVDGIDNIAGGDGNDTINAGPGADTANGGNGNDTILGLGGVDQLDGSAGNDRIFGGTEPDTINGGVGNDLLLGNEANDTITDPSGVNTLNGGPGDDDLTGGTGNDTIFGDATVAQNGDDRIVGGLGQDRLIGFAGQDTIIANDGIADVVNGGPGVDACNTDGIDSVFGCP